MDELIRSNDRVLLSYAASLLEEEGIPHDLADGHMSALEGSIGALACRLLVPAKDLRRSRLLLSAAGLGAELPPEVPLAEPPPFTEPAPALPLTRDAFLGGALHIFQPERGFRAGMDSVLLAAAVPARAGEHALEAGSGAGVASLCLARRAGGLFVTGLELDPGLAALAGQNAALNGFAERVNFETGSVAAPPPPIAGHAFDHVFANPPFLEAGEALGAEDAGRLMARLGPEGILGLFVEFCLRHTAPKGSVTLIHRADRLDRILQALDGRLGALRIIPLWPRAGVPAKRVIVQGRKSSRAPMALLSGLTLHEADGAFTAEAEAILRHGAPLFQD